MSLQRRPRTSGQRRCGDCRWSGSRAGGRSWRRVDEPMRSIGEMVSWKRTSPSRARAGRPPTSCSRLSSPARSSPPRDRLTSTRAGSVGGGSGSGRAAVAEWSVRGSGARSRRAGQRRGRASGGGDSDRRTADQLGDLLPDDLAGLLLHHHLAVDETVILLHPALPLVGVSIVMERERQQNDSLVNGYHHHLGAGRVQLEGPGGCDM